MQELLNRIATQTGLTPDKAIQAVGQILLYIKTESSDAAVETMLDKTPGANEAIVQAGVGAEDHGGGFGGFGGGSGGIMALGSKLMALGLDMDGIRTVATELVAYAREHAGNEAVDRAVQSVPGLSQFA